MRMEMMMLKSMTSRCVKDGEACPSAILLRSGRGRGSEW